jgi:hypothetical protein
VIAVRPLEETEADAYEAYVRHHPAGLVYYGIAYRNLLADELACEHRYLVAVEDGRIRGVLPVMWRESGGRRVYNSLPFYGSHGGALADDADVAAALLSSWNDLISAQETLAGTLVENLLEPTAVEPAHDMLDERISQVTALPRPSTGQSADDLIMAAVDSSARRNVRRAGKAGVVVQRAEGDLEGALETLWRIHTANMDAMGGVAKPRSFFEAIRRHFEPHEDFDVYVATVDGSAAAALLLLHFNQTTEYFTPAVAHEYRSEQPLAAILLRSMADAVQRGQRRWNWGGTWLTQEGVYRFKRKWGARDDRYRYFVKLNDDGLLDRSADELRARFEHFYVVPFSQLRPKGGQPSHVRS